MSRLTWLKIAASITLFILGIGGLQWWKYSHFGYNGLDLGIYSQVVWALSHGYGFLSSIHDPSYLGDHLELWLVPMSWIYRIAPSPLTLLWIQTLLIACSAIPIAKLAHRYLGDRGAWLAPVLFLLNPFVLNSALYEFHALVVALPLLCWAIWWYTEKKYLPWLILLAATVIVREDMPFVVGGFGLLALFDRRPWRWWLPAFGLAAVWFPAAQTLIRAANHDGVYKYLAFYRWAGATPLDILRFPFQHPIQFLLHTITFNNIGTLLGLVAAFGLLPLARARRLWPLLFPAATMILGNAAPGSFLRIHYTIPYLPFLVWATIEALGAAREKTFTLWGLNWSRFGVYQLAIGLGFVYVSLVLGPAEWPWFNVRREPATAVSTLRRALADVGPQERVLTTFAYLPNLANRVSLYSMNYVFLGRRQYSEIPYVVPTPIDVAIIDWQQLYEYQYFYKTTVFQGRSGMERIQDLLTTQGLGLVHQYGTVSVYRRGGSPDQTSLLSQIDGPVTGTKVVPLGPITLTDPPVVYTTPADSEHGRQLVIDAAWHAVSTAKDQPISIRITLQQNSVTVVQVVRLLGQGPTPASEWKPGSSWATRDAVELPNNITGEVRVNIEVFKPEGRYKLNPWRSFRPIREREQRYGTIDVGSVVL